MYPQTHYIYLFPYSLHVLICDIGDTVRQLSLNLNFTTFLIHGVAPCHLHPLCVCVCVCVCVVCVCVCVCVCVSACCISLYILCIVYYFVAYMLDHTRHMRYLYYYLLFRQNKGIPHLVLLLNPPRLIQPLDPPNPPDTDEDLTWYISPTECL